MAQSFFTAKRILPAAASAGGVIEERPAGVIKPTGKRGIVVGEGVSDTPGVGLTVFGVSVGAGDANGSSVGVAVGEASGDISVLRVSITGG